MHRNLHRLAFSRAPTTVAVRTGERAATVVSVALFATGLWWAIFHWGGLALGLGGDAEWLAPALAAIFALLILGLSSAAFAGDGLKPAFGAGDAHNVAEKYQIWRNSSNFGANRRMTRSARNTH